MSLPNDVARCTGYLVDDELREGCEDCMRRTSHATGDWVSHMYPPIIVVFECESRIAPEDYK